MNVLEALRGLMGSTGDRSSIAGALAEGERMKLLGPEYRNRQALTAAQVARTLEEIEASKSNRGRQGREDMNALVLAAREAAQSQNMPSIPVSAEAGGVGPPAPAPVTSDALLGPDGTSVPLGPRQYREDVLAKLRDVEGIKSQAGVDEAVGKVTAVNDLPLGRARREEIWLENQGRVNAAVAAAAAAASRRDSLSMKDRMKEEQTLSKDYRLNTKIATEMGRQFSVMRSAMARWDKGEAKDLNATTQAIITPFNRIMDPASVVRESEYARSPAGQAFIESLGGRAAALLRGGPGVTPESLREFVALASEFEKRAMQSVKDEQERIQSVADEYGLDVNRIMGSEETRRRQTGTLGEGGAATHRWNPVTRKLEPIQ